MSRVAFFVLCLGALASRLVAQESPGASSEAGVRNDRRSWFFADLPLLDFGDDGRPFRFTVALPSEPCFVTRMLFATEARWTLSTGYAKVFDSYDTGTGAFKNPGGHAALFGVARQFRWHPPPAAGVSIPKLVIEFGAQFASRRFPADGTRANFLLITGIEWTWRARATGTEWTAALVWPHFSNANAFTRNAGYDGLALRFGRSVRF